MNYSTEFLRGYRAAVKDLGQEGDYRAVDWSKPYQYLSGQLKTITPTCKTCKGKRQVKASSPKRAKAWMVPCPDCQ